MHAHPRIIFFLLSSSFEHWVASHISKHTHTTKHTHAFISFLFRFLFLSSSSFEHCIQEARAVVRNQLHSFQAQAHFKAHAHPHHLFFFPCFDFFFVWTLSRFPIQEARAVVYISSTSVILIVEWVRLSAALCLYQRLLCIRSLLCWVCVCACVCAIVIVIVCVIINALFAFAHPFTGHGVCVCICTCACVCVYVVINAPFTFAHPFAGTLCVCVCFWVRVLWLCVCASISTHFFAFAYSIFAFIEVYKKISLHTLIKRGPVGVNFARERHKKLI